jgi:hypothetical protein
MPLNVTVLVPCVLPKLDPVIVTDVPTAPDVGFKLLITGEVGGPLGAIGVIMSFCISASLKARL